MRFTRAVRAETIRDRLTALASDKLRHDRVQMLVWMSCNTTWLSQRFAATARSDHAGELGQGGERADRCIATLCPAPRERALFDIPRVYPWSAPPGIDGVIFRQPLQAAPKGTKRVTTGSAPLDSPGDDAQPRCPTRFTERSEPKATMTTAVVSSRLPHTPVACIERSSPLSVLNRPPRVDSSA